MTSRNLRPSISRGIAAALFAGAAILAACEAKLPTATEVDDMTAASAATAGRKSLLLSKDTLYLQYMVDGVAVSAAQANAITPDKIATIEITKGSAAPNGKGLVIITTRKQGDLLRASGEKFEFKMTMPRIAGDTAAPPDDLPRRRLQNFTGVILVDGVRVTEAAMQALKPSEIVSVEIVKGPTAAQLYAAPEAKDGVIKITTTKTAAKQ